MKWFTVVNLTLVHLCATSSLRILANETLCVSEEEVGGTIGSWMQQDRLCQEHDGDMLFYVTPIYWDAPSELTNVNEEDEEVRDAVSLRQIHSEWRCPEGFMPLDDVGCYYFSDPKQRWTWNVSHTICYEKNSHLVSIESELENRIIKEYLNSTRHESYWLGARKYIREGRWMWSQSTRGLRSYYVRYWDWALGKPDDRYESDPCALFSYEEDFQWDDVPCSREHAFICESPYKLWETDQVTVERYGRCPTGFTKLGALGCYEYNPEGKTWNHAQLDCERKRGYLVEIESKEEDLALKEELLRFWNSNESYIGAEYFEEGWRWRYTGRYVLYADWPVKRYNSHHSHHWKDMACATYTNRKDMPELGLEWDKVDCNTVLPYICETDERVWFDGDEEPVTVDCPPNFIRIGSAGCYYFSGVITTSWPSAVTECQRQGGYLASVDSRHENEVLRAHLRSVPGLTDHYMGATNLNYMGHWLWQHSQTQLLFTDWFEGRTWERRLAYRCGGFRGSKCADYQWDHMDCFKHLPYVCETDQRIWTSTLNPNIERKCPIDYVEVGFQGCYAAFLDDRITFARAQYECRQRGGTLLQIDSAMENDTLARFLLHPVRSSNRVPKGNTLIEDPAGFMVWKELPQMPSNITYEEYCDVFDFNPISSYGMDGYMRPPLNCHDKLPYVCETSQREGRELWKPPCPRPYIRLHDGCYYVSHTQADWLEAAETCWEINHGYLMRTSGYQQGEAVRSYLLALGISGDVWYSDDSPKWKDYLLPTPQWNYTMRNAITHEECINSYYTTKRISKVGHAPCTEKKYFVCEKGV